MYRKSILEEEKMTINTGTAPKNQQDVQTKNAYATNTADNRVGSRDDVKKAAADQGENLTKEQLETLKENLQDLLSKSSAVMGAKLTFGQSCFKDYMKIIRAHVRMYSNEGKKNDPENKTTPNKNTDTPQENKEEVVEVIEKE